MEQSTNGSSYSEISRGACSISGGCTIGYSGTSRTAQWLRVTYYLDDGSTVVAGPAVHTIIMP